MLRTTGIRVRTIRTIRTIREDSTRPYFQKMMSSSYCSIQYIFRQAG